MTNSKASWVPAVPPPPVAGAAVTGLAVGFDVTAGLALAVTVSVVTPGLGEVLGSDENEVPPASGVVEEDPEQAVMAAEARMVTVPQPRTGNMALSAVPAIVVRTFMEPPHAASGWRPPSRSRHQETGTGREYAQRPGRGPRRLEAGPRKRRRP
jgi:hypothetical protein